MRIVLYIFTFFIVMVLHTAKVGARKPPRRNSNHGQTTKKYNANHEFDKLCLQEHNKYRAIHQAPSLKINSTLYIFARSWARRLAILDDTSNVTHRPGRDFGENIYWMTYSKQPYEQYATLAVNLWYDENKNYNYVFGGYSAATAHFTQLVWASTNTMGCGYDVSKKGTIFVVCNYNPHGNIPGAYQKNVKPPKS
ncbi:Golgi-associated plant pathogenesis-related protein 1-like [Ixodes scapularis]|uniref:Golgi-associated plant pathogenesis-related protein 1-like n=1 Tax=Ixodes scapularis TaxID=6945 RepID=UPI001A9F81DA|nr:Golgi-associated plant pathogenesis-related protein 1-like [Ixodes scapularis]